MTLLVLKLLFWIVVLIWALGKLLHKGS